ncbi:MAG: endonuclease/exonuclease/phosphatase family protein [Desulfobacterales bacterium]|nr:MAG: endonuclease/exonuclease/phosphatase family protein [Desulfobacterales bacterium]
MREKALEIVFLVLALGFAVAGYGLYRPLKTAYYPIEPDPKGLRIVTWNIGGAGGKTIELPEDKFLSHIAGVLAELDADVVLLQEVAGSRQAHRLSRLLGLHWDAKVARGGYRNLAVLWQRGYLQTRLLSADSRGALLIIYRSSGKPPVLAINVHADPFSAKRRNILLGQTTDALLKEENAKVKILAGDLNLDIDLDKRRDLFTDDEYLDVETYNYIVQHLSDATLNTGSTAEPDRRLDYIFVESKYVNVTHSGPWKGKRVANMDHDPVVADLQFGFKH